MITDQEREEDLKRLKIDRLEGLFGSSFKGKDETEFTFASFLYNILVMKATRNKVCTLSYRYTSEGAELVIITANMIDILTPTRVFFKDNVQVDFILDVLNLELFHIHTDMAGRILDSAMFRPKKIKA